MKNLTKIFAIFFLTLLLGNSVWTQTNNIEIIDELGDCPKPEACKSLGIFSRSKNFQSLQISSYNYCQESREKIIKFEEFTSLSGVANRKDILNSLVLRFISAKNKYRNTTTQCKKGSGKIDIGYEEASNMFGKILDDIEFEIEQEEKRDSAENNSIPKASDIFSSRKGEFLGYETTLKDYTGGQKKGEEQFRTITDKLIEFLKKILIPIAILLLVIAGLTLFLSTSEDEAKKQKGVFWGIANGFGIFALATHFVDYVFFGHEGEILREGSDAVEFAKRGVLEFEGIFDYLQTFVVAIAVVFLVVTSMKLIFGQGEEDTQTKAKKQILYTILGIAMIISLRPILDIFTTNDGQFSQPESTDLIELMSKWADYILGFVGIIAVVSLIYGGARLILDYGNGEAVESAKKIIKWSIVGLVLAFSAWTITNFFTNPSGTGVQTEFETIYTTSGG